VRVTLDARGLAGRPPTSSEDAGIVVAGAHPEGRRGAMAGPLQFCRRVSPASGCAQIDGATGARPPAAMGDVGVPPMRGPIRTLVVEAAVTRPAMFVRRAIEGGRSRWPPCSARQGIATRRRPASADP
jgi:hypothetical protein